MPGTILLADDSITIQKVVELTFAGTGSDVVAVGSGRELLARLPELRPDVILCDVVMPDMNGYDVCQAIKSDPATLHIPVVLLTGTFEPFDRERAVAAGCDSIVTKPFEARELVALVDDLLAKSAATSKQEAPIEPAAFEAAAVPALDFTTTGFDAMVPPPPSEPLPPAEGLEMSGSFVDSSPQAPAEKKNNADTQPVTPPVVTEGRWVDAGDEAPAAETVLASEPPVMAAPTGAGTPLEEDLAPVVEGEGEPEGSLTVEASSEGAEAAAAPASRAGNGAMSDEDVAHVAQKVLELAAPLLERIAWEVIPDMAEMIVRKRIRELESTAEDEA
jgi:CheY-like chemotaxis protein